MSLNAWIGVAGGAILILCALWEAVKIHREVAEILNKNG